MNVKVIERIVVEKNVELNFPLYIKQKNSRVTSYLRITKEFQVVILSLNNEEDNERKWYEIIVENKKDLSDYSSSFLLGEGEYASSKSEFEEAFKKIKRINNKIYPELK
jgi:hypothetical protein